MALNASPDTNTERCNGTMDGELVLSGHTMRLVAS